MIDKLVLGIAGLPGSGKSTVASVAASEGWTVISMGDIVREFAAELGLKPTAENIGALAVKLRGERGPIVIAEECVKRARKLPSDFLVIEGLRSLEELEFFRSSFKRFMLLGVVAPDERRFRNLYLRGREDDPRAFQEFKARERREELLGLRRLLPEAECIIVNDEGLDALEKQARTLVKGLKQLAG
ncbi:MAG: AAA family ATPase [Candidatus Bathyarchaeia archaeon]